MVHEYFTVLLETDPLLINRYLFNEREKAGRGEGAG